MKAILIGAIGACILGLFILTLGYGPTAKDKATGTNETNGATGTVYHASGTVNISR